MKKLLVAVAAIAMLAGCSPQAPKPAEKPQPKPAELLTGRTAFQKLYVAAHGWGRDAQPYRLDSQITADGNGQEGKSAVWRAAFASVAQHGVKPYVWSGSADKEAPSRGVTPGNEDSYNPTNASTQVFDMQYLKVDSDKAYEVAQEHGGDKLLTKTPSMPVFYTLDWNRTENKLEWHVMYGGGKDDAKLRVAVDATTGNFLRVEK
jgi:hypothetical protein